jgi:hypothetical protein
MPARRTRFRDDKYLPLAAGHITTLIRATRAEGQIPVVVVFGVELKIYMREQEDEHDYAYGYWTTIFRPTNVRQLFWRNRRRV